MANFQINGVNIKNPSTFKVERYNVTNMERLANADMTGDLIAKKKKFYFTYEAVNGEELEVIENALDNAPLFFTLTYPYNGNIKQATVYVGNFPSELHRAGTNKVNWVWKNVTFNLIEK